MGYKSDALKGVSWITLLRGLTRIITILRLSVLGRLLTPVEFGFFGIASLLLSLLEILTETGINVFLVQEKRDLKEYIDSAWVVSILRGIVLTILIILFAPVITRFFNSPDALSIVLLTSIVPFIRGFINPEIIRYQKELLFDKEFRLRSVLFLVDVIVSIIVGFVTRSAESFVWGLIASACIEVLLSYILFPLRPRLKGEMDQIKLILKRGSWVTLTGIFSYFADNGDNITVGKLLGSGSLGIYQIAYKFSTLPISEVTNVVNQVVFPVYTKFHDDRDRLWNAFKKVTLASSLVGLLLGTAIFFLARPLILIFMGEQWIAAIPVIQILSLYGILRTIFGSFSPLFLAVGKQSYVARMLFVRVITLLIAVVPLVMTFGMIGAGYAMFLSVLAEIPVVLFLTHLVFQKRNFPNV
jgi:O-antigen/teichoic acid export membrane protein